MPESNFEYFQGMDFPEWESPIIPYTPLGPSQPKSPIPQNDVLELRRELDALKARLEKLEPRPSPILQGEAVTRMWQRLQNPINDPPPKPVPPKPVFIKPIESTGESGFWEFWYGIADLRDRQTWY